MTDTVERRTLAYVVRAHGAWLIHWVGDYAADRPEDENFDAASSLTVAKRIAKNGAREVGCNFRWVEEPSLGGWTLEGVEKEWEG